MALFGMFRRASHERAGFQLYGEAVAVARLPTWYGDFGAPDTLHGRFDLVSLFVALLIRRLRRDGDPRGVALAQAVFDAMFSDMDVNLREMGVSDLAVGKRVRHLWEAFHGRARAYEAALDAGNGEALALAIARNLWVGEPPGRMPDGTPGDPARALAAHALAEAGALAAQEFSALLAGRVRFAPPPEIADAA